MVVYKNPEQKAWGGASKPMLPATQDFLTELHKAVSDAKENNK